MRMRKASHSGGGVSTAWQAWQEWSKVVGYKFWNEEARGLGGALEIMRRTVYKMGIFRMLKRSKFWGETRGAEWKTEIG